MHFILIKKRVLVFTLAVFFFIAPIGSLSYAQCGSYDSDLLKVDLVVIPDTDPFFGMLGSYAACLYPENNSILKPLLVQQDNTLTESQKSFISKYLQNNDTILSFGEPFTSEFQTIQHLGDIISVTKEYNTHLFPTASSLLLLPYGGVSNYSLCLQAILIAQYLHIPFLFYKNNTEDIQQQINHWNTQVLYIVGTIQSSEFQIDTTIELPTSEAIQRLTLSLIKTRFGSLNYITMTNPMDALSPLYNTTNAQSILQHVKARSIYLGGFQTLLSGSHQSIQTVQIPQGIQYLEVYANSTNVTGIMNDIFQVDPILKLTITDPQGKTIWYASSPAYAIGKTYGHSLIINQSGDYQLEISVHQGFQGGYFSYRGISIVDAEINITIIQHQLDTPHLPLIPKLSILSSYLTSAHGGLLVSNISFALTDIEYESAADQSSTGPWYETSLHPYNNKKVNNTVSCLNETLTLLSEQDVLDTYLNGPAWLALLGDTNMIPMYYYPSQQTSIPDAGLPSDNPYSLNHTLSVGRILGYSVADTSTLLCRTLFYKEILGEPEQEKSWHNGFHFVFGEGFGETGGIFHQIPYSKEITEYGFFTTVYGDLRNSRLAAERLKTYTSANYVEYLGHGDWFWFTPSLYGMNLYGHAIDVAHVNTWVFSKPSVFLTSACLMGRVDGIPPWMNIGLTFMHRGCNAFIGSTRETGQESGLSVLENHLILDDYSMGEALRGEKQIDKQPPTYYVRTLYGDPAFNPYDPIHGFSTQGKP